MWSWLSGFPWNIWAPHALPAILLSSSPAPGSVLILLGLRAVGAGRSSFVSCLGPVPWILSDLALSILGSSVDKVTGTAFGIWGIWVFIALGSWLQGLQILDCCLMSDFLSVIAELLGHHR